MPGSGLLALILMKLYIYDLFIPKTGDEVPARLALYAENRFEAEYIIETELIQVGGELFEDGDSYYVINSINAPEVGLKIMLPQNTIEVVTPDGSSYRKDFRRLKFNG
jgi:hypothetical protein